MRHEQRSSSLIGRLRGRLRRHPFAVDAFFARSLVLTYAVPPSALAPLVGPKLQLETYAGWGFVAIALVETRHLRPRGLPAWMGQNFFLSGYRVFVRLVRPDGTALRGLRIIRSDTDRRLMFALGNLFTHYGYRLARVHSVHTPARWQLRVDTPGHEADLDLTAELAAGEPQGGPLPAGSPFPDARAARRFAGPMPFTFSDDDLTDKVVVVKGVRKHWHMRPVAVQVRSATFLEAPPFAGGPVHLANAFVLENVPYGWQAGTLQDSA